MRNLLHLSILSLCALLMTLLVTAAPSSAQEDLDQRVRRFLSERGSEWEDMNIPARDGEFLYDLIVKNGYTRALEIGTSTGHSGIWIAWALSKTGGKLTTIEIDESRHAEAVRNFQAAGLADYIDARLADAHDLVRELPGPFDFVFSDADKDWYIRYFQDVAPKMVAGGCYATHNISTRYGEFRGWVGEYVEYLRTREDFETTIESTRSSGIALSTKRRK